MREARALPSARRPRPGGRPSPRAAVSSLWVASLIVLALGCGPSPRRVHYGDRYFERCAAADATAARPAAERRACWAAWLEHWKIGQPPERIAYAAERMARLDEGDASATVPELGAPPVTTASESADRWDRSPPSPAAERSGICTPTCAPDWDRCIEGCAAGEDDCAAACDAEFQTCVRACP